MSLILAQVKLAKFEHLLDDVSSHCLHHNKVSDTLHQIASDLDQVDVEAIDGSEDALACIEALENIGNRLDSIQAAVDSCLQHSENLLPTLAAQDVDVIRKQSQVHSITHIYIRLFVLKHANGCLCPLTECFLSYCPRFVLIIACQGPSIYRRG